MFNLNDLINTCGVLLILSAFVLQQSKRIDPDSNLYLWLNLIGSSFASLGSILIVAYPFAVLEGVWAGVSAWGLVQNSIKGNGKSK